tara:strand:+ start:279 stop:704 length:426 start_codon:yes stop_codon:yes gene_type:complete
MIKYNLKCNNKHEFESWFSNSNEFEKLKKKKLLECIFCSSKKIEKSIMSPRVIGTKTLDTKKVFPKKEFAKIKKDLVKIKKFVESNFEFVGDRFSHEVRKIYYDNNENRNIYGTASPEEQKELQEEGIELTTIPWIEDKEN